MLRKFKKLQAWTSQSYFWKKFEKCFDFVQSEAEMDVISQCNVERPAIALEYQFVA